jgi:hypothetical protein
MPNTYIRVGRKVQTERSQRVPVARWIDPFPWVQGSSIEKMVFAEFVRRGIYFQHSTMSNPVKWLPGTQDVLSGTDPKTMKADFLLPQFKIWIEVQGGYFHTMPGAVEHDALRFAVIEAAGWRPIFWWEDDIRTRLFELMDAVPEFYRPPLNNGRGFQMTPGLPFLVGEAPDTLKGLRAALSKRARPPQSIRVKRRKKRRKKYGST